MSLGDALFAYEEKHLPPVVVVTTALLIVTLVAGAAIRLVLTLLL
ncbi:hypothetical protein [Natronosalvus halobius]|nr:hypothetical protein [Natronosalvus halobius]